MSLGSGYWATRTLERKNWVCASQSPLPKPHPQTLFTVRGSPRGFPANRQGRKGQGGRHREEQTTQPWGDEAILGAALPTPAAPRLKDLGSPSHPSGSLTLLPYTQHHPHSPTHSLSPQLLPVSWSSPHVGPPHPWLPSLPQLLGCCMWYLPFSEKS